MFQYILDIFFDFLFHVYFIILPPLQCILSPEIEKNNDFFNFQILEKFLISSNFSINFGFIFQIWFFYCLIHYTISTMYLILRKKNITKKFLKNLIFLNIFKMNFRISPAPVVPILPPVPASPAPVKFAPRSGLPCPINFL